MEVTEYDNMLLKTLLSGSKVLNMGRTPVNAIESAFKMERLGLVDITDGMVSITSEGRTHVNSPTKPNE